MTGALSIFSECTYVLCYDLNFTHRGLGSASLLPIQSPTAALVAQHVAPVPGKLSPVSVAVLPLSRLRAGAPRVAPPSARPSLSPVGLGTFRRGSRHRCARVLCRNCARAGVADLSRHDRRSMSSRVIGRVNILARACRYRPDGYRITPGRTSRFTLISSYAA